MFSVAMLQANIIVNRHMSDLRSGYKQTLAISSIIALHTSKNIHVNCACVRAGEFFVSVKHNVYSIKRRSSVKLKVVFFRHERQNKKEYTLYYSRNKAYKSSKKLNGESTPFC